MTRQTCTTSCTCCTRSTRARIVAASLTGLAGVLAAAGAQPTVIVIFVLAAIGCCLAAATDRLARIERELAAEVAVPEPRRAPVYDAEVQRFRRPA